MPFRLYIVPVVGDGSSTANARRPKYFSSDENGVGRVGIIQPGQDFTNMDYGLEQWMVVGASLNVSDDNLVVAKADCFALPFDLAGVLSGAQVTSVQNKLEAINVPAQWVDNTMTWIFVVRKVLGMFSFIQRYVDTYGQQNNGARAPLFEGTNVTLSSTFSSLPAAVRTALISTAQSFGFSTAGLSGGTTLRVILKTMADNFASKQYNFNGVLV